MATPNLHSILQNHVSLSVSCIDRIYLNGYIPKLQTPGQLCFFLHKHLGYPIVSPALFRPLHDRFVDAIKAFADRERVPLVAFERGQDKDQLAAGYRAQYDRAERMVFIGVAQERAWSYKAHREATPPGLVHFDFSRQPVAVNHYYFYLQDPEWGPGFIKVCTYLPYPVRVCLNGHEWVKQQLRQERITFESLDNGFLLRRPGAAAGHLRRPGSGRRAVLLRPLGGATAVATHPGRPRGGFWPPSLHLAAGGEPHSDLR